MGSIFYASFRMNSLYFPEIHPGGYGVNFFRLDTQECPQVLWEHADIFGLRGRKKTGPFLPGRFSGECLRSFRKEAKSFRPSGLWGRNGVEFNRGSEVAAGPARRGSEVVAGPARRGSEMAAGPARRRLT